MGMNPLMDLKWAECLPPEAIHDNTSVTAVAVDSLGFNNLAFIVDLGATDIAITVFKLQECATSGGSYTDVSGAAISPLPSATSDNTLYGIFLHKKPSNLRYFKLVITFGDGTVGGFASAITALGDPQGNVPYNDTMRGLGVSVSV